MLVKGGLFHKSH